MTSPMHDRIEQAYAAFEKQKAAISGLEQAMASAETTVTAKNRAVTVTVDGRGDVVEIKFPTNAYRTMAPAELGNLLVETAKTAREQARETATGMFEALLPARMPLLGVLNGKRGFDEMMDAAVRLVSEPLPGADRPGGNGGQE